MGGGINPRKAKKRDVTHFGPSNGDKRPELYMGASVGKSLWTKAAKYFERKLSKIDRTIYSPEDASVDFIKGLLMMNYDMRDS